MQKYSTLSRLFLLVAVLGTLFVLLEAVLQFFGTSICAAQGCKLVASSARFGDLSIVLVGLFVLASLSILAAWRRHTPGPLIEKLIDLVLVVSLAGEGFFTGYQAFRLHAACIFCLAVFAVLLALSLIRIVQGFYGVIAGFGSLVVVFSLFYLVLPVGATATLPGKELVLFYSADCKYCAEVLKEIEQKRMPVEHVMVDAYTGLLKGIGIEHIPTLYVNRGNEKIFLTGKERILAYLQGCNAGQTPPAKQEKLKQDRSRERTISPLDLGGQKGMSFDLALPPSDEGVCTSDKKCD